MKPELNIKEENKNIELKLRLFVQTGDPRTYEETVMVSDYPKPSCSKCYGRGFKSYNTTSKSFELCGCVNREANRMKKRMKKAYGLLTKGFRQ